MVQMHIVWMDCPTRRTRNQHLYSWLKNCQIIASYEILKIFNPMVIQFSLDKNKISLQSIDSWEEFQLRAIGNSGIAKPCAAL